VAELIITKIDGYDVLPCPFCGKSELIIGLSDLYKWVECVDCMCAGPTDLGVSGAIEAWNNRQEWSTALWRYNSTNKPVTE
jgi:Lar family restriction alleviation protein